MNKVKFGGAIATGIGIVAVTNSIGWGLLIIAVGATVAIILKLTRNKK